MPKLYETGRESRVITVAALHAIDERESWIDGYRTSSGEYVPTANMDFINKAEAEIRDFRKLIKKYRGK